VDDHEFPANDSLVAPHITDLGVLSPGKHRLSIRVDNRLQLPAAGHLVDSHSISDALGAAWNGIVGQIELRSTPLVWIEDVQVFPNVRARSARVKIKSATPRAKRERPDRIALVPSSAPAHGTDIAIRRSAGAPSSVQPLVHSRGAEIRPGPHSGWM